MPKVITMSLSTDSIDNAIAELKAFRDSLELKKDKLLKRLADIGLKEAQVRFTSAMYDGTNDVSVTVSSNAKGYTISADGKAVAFIEFGAGVYYNPSGPYYPLAKPDGIVGIGEYGHGYGKRKAWGYPDGSGGIKVTYGNPAAMPMWNASKEMRSNILKIAKEVFG